MIMQSLLSIVCTSYQEVVSKFSSYPPAILLDFDDQLLDESLDDFVAELVQPTQYILNNPYIINGQPFS